MSSICLILVSVTVLAWAEIAFKLGLWSQSGLGVVAKLLPPGVLIGMALMALYGAGTLL